jgi:glycerophosphoryl diester phosphodiesterase
MAVVATFIIGIRATTSESLGPSVFYAGAPERPLVIAHRGGAGERPENTLLAFEQAVAVGADILELDVRSSADNILVVHHDANVDRTTNGTGLVHELTLAELQALDAAYHWPLDSEETPYRGLGVKIPTLAQVLQRLPGQRFTIELKQLEPSIVKPLCVLLEQTGALERVLVASFDGDNMRAFRKACPDVATSAHRWEVVWFTAYAKIGLVGLYSPKAQVLQVPPERYGFSLSDADFASAARRRGVRTEVWTVNDPEAIKQLYAAQVDGVMTDYPERAVALLP